MRQQHGNNSYDIPPGSDAWFQQLDEDELIRLVQARGMGWKLAFNSLLGRHRRGVLSHCVLRLGNHQDAQDVCQQVMLRAFNALERFEGRSSLRTWLHSITENQCRTFVVQRARYIQSEHIELLLELADEGATASDVERFAEQHAVAVALEQVTPPAREILRLRFFEDRSLDDIARTLEISLSAAKMRLYRALDQFKVHYLALVEAPAIFA